MHRFNLHFDHYLSMSEMHEQHPEYMEMLSLRIMSLDEFARARLRPEFEQWLDSTGYSYEIRYIKEGYPENLSTHIVVLFPDSAPAVLFKLAWGG